MRVEGRESLGTFKVAVEGGREKRDGEQRQRLTSNHSRKTRRPSETVASCGGPEPRDGRRGTRLGRAEERRRSASNLRRVVDTMWERGRLGRKKKKMSTRDSWFSRCRPRRCIKIERK